MYLQHFGLKHDPLGKSIRKTVPSEQQTLLHNKLNWLTQTRGIGLITGEAGTGKTKALHQWADSLNPLTHKFIYQADNHFKAFDIYSQLADTLGLGKYQRYSGLWRALKQHLLDLHDNKQLNTVWILDEAHNLPSNFLSELPAFLNFSFDSREILMIVLVGNSMLHAALNKKFYNALTSRLLFQFQWCAIDDFHSFQKFIIEAFQNAGVHSTIIGQSALQLIHMASKGQLRDAHQIITLALLKAAEKNLNHLPDDIVQQSIDESK